jgi:ATP-dependent Clp protease adapter protein ClpS
MERLIDRQPAGVLLPYSTKNTYRFDFSSPDGEEKGRGVHEPRISLINDQSMQVVTNLEPNFGKVNHSAVMTQTWAAIETPVLVPSTDQSNDTKNDRGWMVTVYNNDYNTDIEVIAILMVATKCDAEEAAIETWEIDKLGQSIVHRASQKECEEAARIIATIGIRVEAEPDPLA